ncbi:MAG: amidohydrolase family protein [Acidobacteriota bacterium]|jgi:predicted TIM-barrel fold metal-dependent hydrolase|nr:amidohydrolase [Bryobacteraceae bacterium CoA2 C42]MCA2963939.1 amidohydrolase [Acidobacteriaceae bacterium]
MRETGWGRLAVRDAHVHFFSHRFFGLLTGGDPAEATAKLGWETPPEAPEGLAERWIGEMDRQGVDAAALIASLPGDEESVGRALERAPERFYGWFLVNPLAADARERTARARAMGLRTVCLFPAMHGYSVGDERLTPFWELLAGEAGANVFVHCGVLSVGVRKKLGLPSLFDPRYSNPLDVQGIAMRYPGLRVVIPHFGAGFFREALMVADHCPNVYLDTSSSNGWMRYAEGELDLEMVFRRALDVVGARRLLFGTDSSFFPRGWVEGIFREQSAILERIGVNRTDAAAILGGNLAELHGP